MVLPLIDEHNKTEAGDTFNGTELAHKESLDANYDNSNWNGSCRCPARWDRNMRSKYNDENFVDLIGDEDFSILEMANYITVPLKTGSIKYLDRQRPSMRQPIANTEAPIQRIGGKDGTCTTFDRKKERTRVDREAALYAEGM
jgi:hypothetical protein